MVSLYRSNSQGITAEVKVAQPILARENSRDALKALGETRPEPDLPVSCRRERIFDTGLDEDSCSPRGSALCPVINSSSSQDHLSVDSWYSRNARPHKSPVNRGHQQAHAVRDEVWDSSKLQQEETTPVSAFRQCIRVSWRRRQ